MMVAKPRASSALGLLLALATACKSQETQITVVIPSIDGGTCSAYRDVSCVNYVEFKVTTATASISHCVEVDMQLADLCDVGKLGDGRELFKLPPETQLPITVEGKRVFPAKSCGANQCDKIVFRGTTVGTGSLGDYVGRPLELTINTVGSCGRSEDFFSLPDGGTCAAVCGGESEVVCDQIPMGCLCNSRRDGGQGGID